MDVRVRNAVLAQYHPDRYNRQYPAAAASKFLSEEVAADAPDVEGLIFYTLAGKWVTFIYCPITNQTLRVQVDYNPWTGERLA